MEDLGEDLVKGDVTMQGGDRAHPARRWEVLLDLLRPPKLPSALAGAPQ